MEPSKVFPIYQLQDAFEAFCNGEPAAKPQHRSLYYFLLGYCRRRGNTPRFSLTFEAGMHGSAIGSWATYDAAMKALAEWGFIKYTPGANRYKVPVVELTFRNPTDDVLMTYWQSYCLSTSDPSANPSGDQLVTLKEDLKKGNKEAGKEGRSQAQGQPASQPDSFSSSPENEKPAVDKGPPKGYPHQAEVFKMAGFSAFLKKMNYGHVHIGHYLPEVMRAAELGKDQRDETGWENFVLKFFKNEVAFGRPLILRETANTQAAPYIIAEPPPSQQTTPEAIARQAELDAQAAARTKAHLTKWANRRATNAAD